MLNDLTTDMCNSVYSYMLIEHFTTFDFFEYAFKNEHVAGNTNFIYYKSLNYRS